MATRTARCIPIPVDTAEQQSCSSRRFARLQLRTDLWSRALSPPPSSAILSCLFFTYLLHLRGWTRRPQVYVEFRAEISTYPNLSASISEEVVTNDVHGSASGQQIAAGSAGVLPNYSAGQIWYSLSLSACKSCCGKCNSAKSACAHTQLSLWCFTDVHHHVIEKTFAWIYSAISSFSMQQASSP